MSDSRPSGSSKRDEFPSVSSGAPAKRPKTESGGHESLSTDGASQDSPSKRGQHRGAPGGGDRGGRGGGSRGRGGRGGRGRGGVYDNRGRLGRGGKHWGGDGRVGRMREWGPKPIHEGGEAGEGGDEEKKERFPKKKVAVLIGYNGIGYSGSQINPAVPTIEGDIFKAFVQAGAVSEDNSVNPQKVGLSRAARTDAGVHAAVNVLTLKLILAPPSLPAGMSIEDHINSFLPSTIRLWEILRVQGSFSPRSLCDQRHYEYTVPTHVFLGPKPGSPMATWIAESRSGSTASTSTAHSGPSTSSVAANHTTVPSLVPLQSFFDTPASEIVLESTAESALGPTAAAPGEPLVEPIERSAVDASASFWALQPPQSTFADDLAAKRKWRMPPSVLQEARAFVKAYEGSHNYYNFTVGKDFRDRSCQRVMRKLEVSDPFTVNDVEYVSVSFLGQSFMLHQIRKMIGLAILAIRSSTPSSLVPETFGPSRIHIPKAPGLGLLLLEPQYVEYNKRVEESNQNLDGLKAAGRIDEVEFMNTVRDPVKIAKGKAKVEQFKKEEIYKKMWEVEEKDATFSKWLNYLDYFAGSDFEYLNPRGVIPPSATFKKGENPEKVRLPAGAEVPPEEVTPPSDDEGAAGEEEG